MQRLLECLRSSKEVEARGRAIENTITDKWQGPCRMFKAFGFYSESHWESLIGFKHGRVGLDFHLGILPMGLLAAAL